MNGLYRRLKKTPKKSYNHFSCFYAQKPIFYHIFLNFLELSPFLLACQRDVQAISLFATIRIDLATALYEFKIGYIGD